MATKTKADLAEDILRHLGVLAVGQSASAEDGTLTEEAIDSVYKRVYRDGLAPYPLTAIPEWAQDLLRNSVAGTLCGAFGITGPQRSEYQSDGIRAEREMCRQTSAKYDPRVVTTFKDY